MKFVRERYTGLLACASTFVYICVLAVHNGNIPFEGTLAYVVALAVLWRP